MTQARKWPNALLIGGILLGGIVLPVAGWVVCIALFWAQKRWSTRQKLIATIAVPGGLLPAFLVLVVIAQPAPGVGIVLLVVLTVIPIWMATSLWTALFSPQSRRVPTPNLAIVVIALKLVVVIIGTSHHTGGRPFELWVPTTTSVPVQHKAT